jgi:hypothetical protein
MMQFCSFVEKKAICGECSRTGHMSKVHGLKDKLYKEKGRRSRNDEGEHEDKARV